MLSEETFRFTAALLVAVDILPTKVGAGKISEPQKTTFGLMLEAQNVVTVLLSGLLLATIHQSMFTFPFRCLIAHPMTDILFIRAA